MHWGGIFRTVSSDRSPAWSGKSIRPVGCWLACLSFCFRSLSAVPMSQVTQRKRVGGRPLMAITTSKLTRCAKNSCNRTSTTYQKIRLFYRLPNVILITSVSSFITMFLKQYLPSIPCYLSHASPHLPFQFQASLRFRNTGFAAGASAVVSGAAAGRRALRAAKSSCRRRIC